MSTPSAPPPPPADATPPKPSTDSAEPAPADGDVKMEEAVPVVEEETLPEEILNATPEEIMTRVRLIDNDLKVSLGFVCAVMGVKGGPGRWC